MNKTTKNQKAHLFYALLKKIPIAMRITLLLLFVLTFQLQAEHIYSQDAKISLDMKNSTIEKVLQTIEEKSDYYFLYNNRLINVDRKVSVRVRNAAISAVLEKLFKSENVEYEVKGTQIILHPKEMHRQITAVNEALQQHKKDITGTIVDAAGLPIIGANIVEIGTNNGTVTDVNGKFSLSVENNATIHISYIGYLEQNINTERKTIFNITLQEDMKALDELVVVGYGVQQKATVTGAISSVKGELVSNSGSLNVSNSIAGRIPGVIANNRSGEPGSDWSSILIRGKGTLNDNSPLIVIDGVANRDGMERINPNDIESISVLKDASAAIYGAQAANGVILVTTKSGIQSKPTIEYNGSISLSQHTRTPNLLNAYDWMVYDDEIKGHMNQTKLWTNIKEGYKDGSINKSKYGDTDWMNVMFRTVAPQTRHSISLRGGSESVSYYVSGDLTYQEPLYRNTVFNFKTNQVRVNIDAEVTKDLLIGVNASGRNENRYQSPISAGTMFWEAFMAYPYLYDYYPNGLPAPGIAWGNNLAILASGKEIGYDNVQDFFLNTKFNFKLDLNSLTEGLALSGYAAFDPHFRNQKIFNDVWDTYNYDEINDEYIKQTTNAVSNIITLNQSNDKKISTTYNVKLDFIRQFDKQKFSGFIAYEQSKNNGEFFDAWRGYFLSNQFDYLNNGGDKDKTNSGYGYVHARQNIFGRLNYNYLSKYMIEFTLRHDGSMNFAKEKRWGTFPGISAGWRISEENFMNSINWVDDLKLRGSWGKLGNDRVSQFQYLSTFNMVNGAVLGESAALNKGFSPGRIGNPSITWEKVDTKNIALEGVLWNQSLNFVIEYFNQNRKDILTKKMASIPSYTGLTLPDQNIGEVTNQGIEFVVNYNQIVNDFKYYVGANLTYAKNKIVFFDEAANTTEWQRRTGYPIDSWLMYKTDGIFQSKEEIEATPHFPGARPGDIRYVDVDGDGSITSNDKVRDYISNIPQIVFGLNMGASWKNFDLDLLWSGQTKAKQMIIPVSYNTYQKLFDNRWISAESTPDAKYPRAFNKDDGMNTRYSDFWLYDASFIRLKNLVLSYTLPQKMTNKDKVNTFRIFLKGDNLFTIDRIKFLDPETSSVNAGHYYPQQRTYTLGINISF